MLINNISKVNEFMVPTSFGSTSRIALIAGGALLLLIGQASGACYGPAAQLPASAVADFKSNPLQMLVQNPAGGAQMVSRLRDLVASDPSTLSLVMSMLPSTNKDQKTAMGAALAQAARICVRTDRAFAVQIQQVIAETKGSELIAAFASAAGDQPIAAAGGPGFPGGAGGATSPP